LYGTHDVTYTEYGDMNQEADKIIEYYKPNTFLCTIKRLLSMTKNY